MRIITAARKIGSLEGQFVEWVIKQAPLLDNVANATPILLRTRHGLALQAVKSYQMSEEVMRIPMDLWGPQSAQFALETARAEAPTFYQELAALNEAHGGKLGGPIALATHLAMALVEPKNMSHIYCNLLYETSVHTPPHPLLLNSAALSSLFQASPLVQAMEARRRLYAHIHERLFPPGNGIPLSLLLWGVSRVLSRAISGQSRPLTLVPYFDMINHSATPNCEYDLDHPKGDIVLRAICPISPQDEITISYGSEKNNHKLLSLYGFVDEENATSIKLRIPNEGASGWIKAKLAHDSSTITSSRMSFLHNLQTSTVGGGAPAAKNNKKQTMLPNDWIIGGEGQTSTEDSFVKTLASYMVLVSNNLADLPTKDGMVGDQLAKAIVLHAPTDVWTDAVHAMRLNLQEQESKYNTTLEQDESALQDIMDGQHQQEQQAKTDTNQSKIGLRRSALCLLIEEKRLIQKAVSFLKDRDEMKKLLE